MGTAVAVVAIVSRGTGNLPVGVPEKGHRGLPSHRRVRPRVGRPTTRPTRGVAVSPRIALVASSFHPYVGGVESHVRHVARELRAAGTDVEVWTVDRGEHLGVTELDGTVVRHLPTPMPARSARALSSFAAAAPGAWHAWSSAFRTFRPDVLHVQCFVPNGVGPVPDAPASGVLPDSVDLGPRRVVLGVGRLETTKGFDLLVEAFASLADVDAALVLVGDGAQREALRALGDRLDLGDRLQLVGPLDEAGVHAW